MIDVTVGDVYQGDNGLWCCDIKLGDVHMAQATGFTEDHAIRNAGIIVNTIYGWEGKAKETP